MSKQRSRTVASGLYEGMATAWGDTTILRQRRNRSRTAEPVAEAWSTVGETIRSATSQMEKQLATDSSLRR